MLQTHTLLDLNQATAAPAGGWVQPDEANTNFDILVNQITEGHDYLLKNFGVRPRIAWQVRAFAWPV